VVQKWARPIKNGVEVNGRGNGQNTQYGYRNGSRDEQTHRVGPSSFRQSRHHSDPTDHRYGQQMWSPLPDKNHQLELEKLRFSQTIFKSSFSRKNQRF